MSKKQTKDRKIPKRIVDGVAYPVWFMIPLDVQIKHIRQELASGRYVQTISDLEAVGVTTDKQYRELCRKERQEQADQDWKETQDVVSKMSDDEYIKAVSRPKPM